MIKKIKSADLLVGMYVHDINCGWVENPFFTKSFPVRNQKTIDKITGAKIAEVYIDVEKGVSPKAPQPHPQSEQPTEETRQETKDDVEDRVSVEEEIENAADIKNASIAVVKDVFKDCGMGARVELAKVGSIVDEMIGSLFNNRRALTMLTSFKNKDDYTFMHAVHVCVLMLSFCRTFRMDKEQMISVGIGALLHDIGKTNVPDDILNKKGKLNDGEFATIKEHVIHGSLILSTNNNVSELSLEVLTQHHERRNGTGYPLGLEGGEISKLGQMCAVVDVYDAITSDRCYHKGLGPADALRKMWAWTKTDFSQEMMQYFIRCVGKYPVGSLVRMESGQLAVVIEQSPDNILTPTVRYVYHVEDEKFITPFDKDLSKTDGTDEDRILDHEDAEKWGIKPLRFLDIYDQIGA